MRDPYQPFAFYSEPEGAIIEVIDQSGDVRYWGEAPFFRVLDTKDGYFQRACYTVKANKDGYTPTSTTICPSIARSYWGNFLIGGLLGLLYVDPESGAIYEFRESSVKLTLMKL